KVIERAERKQAEPGPGADQGRRSRSDRAVAPADDEQLVAALGGRPGPDFALAAVDQLDSCRNAGRLKRSRDCLRDLRVARGRAAGPVDESSRVSHGRSTAQSAGPIRNAASLLPSGSRK